MPPTLPTRQELEILKIVWELGDATVRDVYERMRDGGRKVAYTTIMTLMTIMADKGHLRRSRDGRAYRYQASQSRARVLKGLVNEFLSRVFDGSAEPLMVHLIQKESLSVEELEKLWEEAESHDS